MDRPTGMTAYAYPFFNEKMDLLRFVSHNINYITLDLEAGSFHTLVFNQDESEYGSFRFSNLENYNTASVNVVQAHTSNWFATKTETKVGAEPEWLAVGVAEEVEVTEEMVEIAEQEFLASLNNQVVRAATKTVNDVATIKPISVIKQIEFRVYCEGLYNLRSIRASLDGLAEGCILSTRETTSGKVSHTIDEWDVQEYPENIVVGDLVATLSTFGIPAGHSGVPEENVFSIHLLLVDNQTVIDYDFKIGDLLTRFNEMNGMDGEIQKVVVNLTIPERLPDVAPVGGSGGGFDVIFDNWGDEIVTEIPI